VSYGLRYAPLPVHAT